MNVGGAGGGGGVDRQRWREPTDDVVQIVRPKNKTRDYDDEELSGGEADNKNWRGIVIALLVIVVICFMVGVAIYLVSPKDVEEVLGEPFTLENVYEYSVNKFIATWIADRNVLVYHSDEDGNLYELDADTNETRIIMETANYLNLNIFQYWVSPDLSYVLIAHDAEPVYKHSFRARYTIYNRHSPDINTRLIQFPQNDEMTEKLQMAAWAPRDHALTFVYGNNLYYQPNPFTTPIRVADNKGSKYVLNGIADWLYEEEILHDSKAHWMSNDSRYVAYIQFNDTNVPVERFPVYNDPNDIYGNISEVSYPKAGDLRPDINPTVRLFIAETANVKASHRLISPPSQLHYRDHYITMVRWRDNMHVLIAWSNRAQNRTIITLCHVVSADCQENLVENQVEGRGWVFIEDVHFIRKGQQYLTVLPEHVANAGYWKHIALIPASMDREGMKMFVTHGAWDVMAIVGVKEEFVAGYASEVVTIYFIGTNGDPKKRHLFKVAVTLNSHTQKPHADVPECITCNLGPGCQYVNAVFSRTGQFYIEECLGPDIPKYVLRQTSTIESEGNANGRVMEDNDILRQKLSKKALPKKDYFKFTSDGIELEGQILLPPRLNKDHITLYPLLIHTYGGPDTQLVTEEFKLDWSTYLTSSENVIYASFDGRGSSGRGTKFMHAVHRRLGTIEIQDQIAGAHFLQSSLKYVDKDRIAIWGWSYGGFVVTHVLGDKEDTTVRCGIAVAPVTDWRYYDTAYTERYMGFATSNDNYRAYDNSNVCSKARYFRGKGFLLIHGTADDNVHFQNSAQLMKALTEEGVMYQTQVYPDKNHNLAGSTTTRHHYRTMTRFLQKECWGGGKPHEAKPVVVDIPQKQKTKS